MLGNHRFASEFNGVSLVAQCRHANSVPYQKVKVGPLCQNIMPPQVLRLNTPSPKRPSYAYVVFVLVWACGAFQWCNQNSIWYADWRQAGCREAQANMERNWQRKTAVSGSSPQLTLKKGAPGDQVWDLLCVQLASYLERGPLMWMMPLHLHVNQKSDYDIWYV